MKSDRVSDFINCLVNRPSQSEFNSGRFATHAAVADDARTDAAQIN